ncbi:MAG TPA: DUF3857 domain-containing protein, partial [Candidatus Xenobia bacterium]
MSSSVMWKTMALVLLATTASHAIPDATILKDVVSVSVQGDGHWTTAEHDVIRLATDEGVSQFGTLSRTYNAETTEVVVQQAGTVDAQGTLHPLPDTSIHDQAVPEVQNDPIYGRLRQLSVTWKEARPGTTIEFRLETHHRHLLWPGQVWDSSWLEDVVPVQDSLFEVSFPTGLAMAWHGVGRMEGVAPQVDTSAGRETWRWHAQDVPGLAQEPGMPPLAEVAGRIEVSSATSWADLVHTLQEAWDTATDPGTLDLSSWLKPVAGLTGDARLSALVREIQQRTVEVNAPVVPPDWRPLPLEQVAQARRLSSPDRVVLLVGLLRALGVPATVGLAGDG